MNNFEKEMLGVYDIEEADAPGYMGRDKPPELVWRHSGGAPCGPHHASTNEGRQWRYLQHRFEDCGKTTQSLWEKCREERQVAWGHPTRPGPTSAHSAVLARNAISRAATDAGRLGTLLGFDGKAERHTVEYWKSLLQLDCFVVVASAAKARA